MWLSLTRRKFALLSGAGLLTALAGWGACSRSKPDDGAVFDADQRQLLLLLTARLCGGEQLGLGALQLAKAHAGSVELIERVLEGTEPYVPQLAQQVRDALTFVEYAPTMLGSWSRFSALHAEAQDSVLEDWMRSSRALCRDVFTAFKGFCTLAFYEQAEVRERIGERPSLIGQAAHQP
jgi:hypothetical protein